MMKSYQIVLIVVAGLFAISFAEEVCKDHNKWCHYMSKYGSCTWNNNTRKTCPRTCGVCSVTCPKTEPSQRRDCGYVGIGYLDCFHNGCCWSPLETSSKYPWCFYPDAPSKDMSDIIDMDEECQDTSDWCHYHTMRGGCHFSDLTKTQCKKSCNLC